MPIIGMNFTSIDAHFDEKKAGGHVNINSSPSIENIRKKDINLLKEKDVVAIEFKFTTSYEPKIGEINLRGEILYQTDDAKKILADWKDKNLDSKITVDVLNTIFKKCLTKAAVLAEDLRLPPPITFPTVTSDNKNKPD